jgi:D-alanine transaminase/branched-chain amino acid aminotransferase
MSELYCIVNDRFVPLSQATLPVNDLSVQRGYGVFDYFRTERGKPLFWDDHLIRLERSCLEMRLPIDREALRASLGELVALNGIADSGIRITVTGGCSDDLFSITGSPNVVIVQQPLKIASPAPLRLMTVEHQRQLPHVKSLDYMMPIYLHRRLVERGMDDLLYLNNGHLRECPRANVFIVTATGQLATASDGILPGVTRSHVLQLAHGVVDAAVRDVTLAEVREAREVFITSTTRKIVPVCQIDGQRVGNGMPGPVTTLLMNRLNAYVEAVLAGDKKLEAQVYLKRSSRPAAAA